MKRVLGRRGYSYLSALTLARRFRSYDRRVLATIKTHLKTDINWGNSSCAEATFNGSIITNKLRQLRILSGAEIPCLEVYTDRNEAEFPVFCRQQYHQAGRDIVIAHSIEEIPASVFFITKAERFSGELRIHTFKSGDDLLTKAFKKVTSEEEPEYPIRNLEHSYQFKLVSISDELRTFLSVVMDTLNMDFFCIDIGRNSGKQYKVIEVNSAPSLINNANTLDWYVNNFGRDMFPDWEDINDKDDRTTQT